LPM
jgi:leucyl-tRNA synthetase